MASPSPPKVLTRLHRALVVSVQADEGSPLRDPAIIAALALAAEQGGAAGLRVRSCEDVRAVRLVCGLPIIGLTKRWREGSEVYITPTPAEVRELAQAGCDLVAFDATRRPGHHPVPELVRAAHEQGILALADISTLEEARLALEDGADMVSSTLSGYTAYSPQLGEPDWTLMADLAAAGLPFIAEGRIRTPAEAARALALGAHCVVVGSAITRPDEVTRWFADALRAARPDVAQPDPTSPEALHPDGAPA